MGWASDYALSSEIFATPLAKWFGHQYGLLKMATPMILMLETAGPFLVFVPFRNALFRGIAILLFMGFHLANLLLFSIGLFSPIGMVAWTVLIPGGFWDRLPSFWAAYRPKFAQFHHRRLFYGRSWTAGILTGIFLVYILIWNLGTLPGSRSLMPESLEAVGYFTRVDQSWQMFAKPIIDDGWFVVAGTLYDGRKLDLFNDGKPLTWKKPRLVSATFVTDRWRKFMLSLYQEEGDDYLLNYGKYLCRQWNGTHYGNDTLETLEVAFMREDILATGGKMPSRKVSLWRHECVDAPRPDIRVDSLSENH